MNVRQRFSSRLSTLLVPAVFAVGGAVETAFAQDDVPARIRREQDEVLRKTERLRELMNRLLERYERDGRTEQARLLKAGIAHLEASRLLPTAAQIPTDLDAGAYDNALREQSVIVAELESLLDILLERQSIENLDEEIDETNALIDDASELLDRQREIREAGERARETSPESEAEREITNALDQLADAQRAESVENERRAGSQLPVLESALARIQSLLEAQTRLESGAQQQLSGQPDPARAEAFELGAIEQAQRDLNQQRGLQQELERLRADAAQVSETAEDENRDPDRFRTELERLRARLDAAAQSARQLEDPTTERELSATREALQNASADARDEASRSALADAAKAVENAAKQAADRRQKAIGAEQSALADRARNAAKAAQEPAKEQGGEPEPTDASRAIDRAADAMEAARDAGNARTDADPNAARDAAEREIDEATNALRRMAAARNAQRDDNPAPEQRARSMANRTEDVARDLRASSPERDDDVDDASRSLDSAEQALRSAEEDLAKSAEDSNADPAAIEKSLQRSRAGLEDAARSIERAMGAARSEEADQASEAAAERQRALSEQAEQLGERVQQGEQSGQLSKDQARSAQDALDRAQKSMQDAEQQLEAGKPSSASKSQEAAARELEKAAQGIRENRDVSQAEKEELERLADRQETLEEDIIRLAKLAEERENKRAADALKAAAEASRRAREQLDDGDQPQAEDEQQEVEEKIQQAQEALEEERDRYMDLRQEELLFRIQEELTEFLEAQEPLTQQTAEAADGLAERGRLSRPQRRKLNQISEREGELVTRLEFILAALREEGVLVFSHVLESNIQDLRDVQERLAGRRPDPGEFTVLLQRDVEARTRKLIDALLRERERRKQERNGQQQQEPKNQLGQQKQPLVPPIAELEMLRRMEEDMQTSTFELRRLIDASSDGITEFDIALTERLASRHAAVSEIFRQLRARIEESMQQQQEDPLGGDDDTGNEERGR